MSRIRIRSCLFTLFKENLILTDDPLPWLKDDRRIIGFCYQIEQCPDTGRKHIQGFIIIIFSNSIVGYLNFKNALALGTIKNILKDATVHIEKCKKDLESWNYCCKEETRIGGPWTKGNPPSQGKRNDLVQLWEDVKAKKTALNIVEENPKMANREKVIKFMRFLDSEKNSDRQVVGVRVVVIYGAADTGKTYAAVNYFGNNDYMIVESPCRKGDKLWFDGYEGQKTIILDDFSGDTCSFTFLKRLLDKYKLRIEIKGGYIWANWTTVIITSNQHPRDWYGWANEGTYSEDALKRRIQEIRHCEYKGLYRIEDWTGDPISDTLSYEPDLNSDDDEVIPATPDDDLIIRETQK